MMTLNAEASIYIFNLVSTSWKHDLGSTIETLAKSTELGLRLKVAT